MVCHRQVIEYDVTIPCGEKWRIFVDDRPVAPPGSFSGVNEFQRVFQRSYINAGCFDAGEVGRVHVFHGSVEYMALLQVDGGDNARNCEHGNQHNGPKLPKSNGWLEVLEIVSDGNGVTAKLLQLKFVTSHIVVTAIIRMRLGE